MSNLQRAQELRKQAADLERQARDAENSSNAAGSCGCKIAVGVTRTVAGVGLAALLGLPVSF